MLANNQSVIAVIPAAGTGQRMAADKPKQYLLCNGKPVISYSLELFNQCDWIDAIYVCLSERDDHWDKSLEGKFSKVRRAAGGTSRAESVANGLKAALQSFSKNTWVLVHDAARPCLSVDDLELILNELNLGEQDGFILADKINDTVKKASDGQHVSATVDRTRLWRAQTPQVFQLGALSEALRNCNPSEITDEASAMELTGNHVKLLQGNPRNIKVTKPEDLALAELYLKNS